MARGRGLIREAREAAGYPVDRLHEEEIQRGRAFIPTVGASDRMHISYGVNAPKVIPAEAEKRLRIIYLFANYLGENIDNITITSTFRTPERQAYLMMRYHLHIPSNTTYRQNIRDIHDSFLTQKNKDLNTKVVETYLSLLEYVKNNLRDFNHCNVNTLAVDAIPFRSTEVASALNTFKSMNKYINSDSLVEDTTNHFVFTGLSPTNINPAPLKPREVEGLASWYEKYWK